MVLLSLDTFVFQDVPFLIMFQYVTRSFKMFQDVPSCLVSCEFWSIVPRSEFLGEVSVVIGEHDRRVPDAEEQTFTVRNIRVHDKYRYYWPMSYDVALLELNKRIQLGTALSLCCVASKRHIWM